ncbi:hypothetical protein [Halobacillus yeomjeoni]|uniref:Uncharacterized protein n=1 Tax=Halobacillus yeomjeoni TaxID=311194 RepID=A0A931MTY9_9BACI|nr:hypothetical protein [Halobacillus yeomjeoni]MBH0228854.1 hypothetical protein [Halobacillus yeomjeoni]
MSCNGCGCCGFCCPDEEQQGFCPCCTRTLVDIFQAIIAQFPGQTVRIFLPGPAGQIVNAIPIQIRNGFLLEVLQGANQRIVNICDIVAVEGAPVNDADLSAIGEQENCECCEQALTELMTEIASVPVRDFDLNTQSQQAGSIQASNPTEVFDGVVRVTSGNNKSIVSLCHVSSVDRIVPPLL